METFVAVDDQIFPGFLMGSLLLLGGSADIGVNPGITMSRWCCFRRDSLLDDSQQCFREVTPKPVYGVEQCGVCINCLHIHAGLT